MERIINENAAGAPQNPLGNVNLSEIPYITCEKCEGTVFEEKMMMKKVSKFMTGSPQDTVVPIPVVACSKCSHVNELFMPRL